MGYAAWLYGQVAQERAHLIRFKVCQQLIGKPYLKLT